MCCVYGLQGASWATTGLFCGAGVLHFGALWAWRWQSAKQNHRAPAGEVRNVLIVGAGGVGRRVASYMEEHPEAGRRVCGFLDDDRALGNGVIGRVSELARLARTGFVDEIILAAPHDRGVTLQVLREARRLRLDLKIVPELFGCKPAGWDFERVGDIPVISLHAERLPSAGLILKRVVDVAGADLVLTVLSPLLFAIAGLIKLDSRGPVLYCAQRAGRKGRLFRCYKFRTMVSDADALKANLRRNNQRSGPFFKIAGDPRITRLGRLLRRYSLDELPQLWNVVKGDMSLVGPRPHPLDDVAGYEIEHLSRLDVTPGITGLWQVTARRDPSFRARHGSRPRVYPDVESAVGYADSAEDVSGCGTGERAVMPVDLSARFRLGDGGRISGLGVSSLSQPAASAYGGAFPSISGGVDGDAAAAPGCCVL